MVIGGDPGLWTRMSNPGIYLREGSEGNEIGCGGMWDGDGPTADTGPNKADAGGV